MVYLDGRSVYDGHCFVEWLTARNQGASPRCCREIRALSVTRVGDFSRRLPSNTSDGVPLILMTDYMVSRDSIMASIENREGEAAFLPRRSSVEGLNLAWSNLANATMYK